MKPVWASPGIHALGHEPGRVRRKIVLLRTVFLFVVGQFIARQLPRYSLKLHDFNLNQPFQGRGDYKMCAERLTIGEMERKYPNEWLFIIEPEISENTELLGGIVSVHSRVRDDVYDALDGFIGGAAIHYTGKMPEGKLFLL